ncbi:hypothetical protein DPMN_144803 [Dreissena polymorpha]|uniref:Tyrosine-protein kinase ephrin type A/B receptor-like domain-containing protein n=2 Tax=Dreissena polymorpha TaxID=45954 RepID=A0A9D4F2T2_DREPO|nr:hypothetical protein DPMN_144803 [Dreissena polymorpha]
MGTIRQCYPFCDDGYAFDSDLFLDNIMCGPDTGYVWNIRSDENPDSKIGTCTEIKLAEGNTMKYAGTYEDLTPDVAAISHTNVQAVIRSTVQTQLDELQCVQNGSCSVSSLKVTNTATTSRHTRSNTPHVGFLVELSCTPSKDPSWCYDILEETYYTLQRRVNETRFSIKVDETLYDIGPNGTQVEGEVDCPPGTVEMDYFCVQCGPGSYPVDYFCERCPRGTYKEDFTSPECTPCPSGLTTEGLQSIHPSMCNVLTTTSAESVNKLDGNRADSNTLTIAISAVVSAVAAIGVVVAMRCYKKTRKHSRTAPKHSWASMNMVYPNLSASIEKFNIIPRKAEQAKIRYIRDDLFVCNAPPPVTEFPRKCDSMR